MPLESKDRLSMLPAMSVSAGLAARGHVPSRRGLGLRLPGAPHAIARPQLLRPPYQLHTTTKLYNFPLLQSRDNDSPNTAMEAQTGEGRVYG